MLRYEMSKADKLSIDTNMVKRSLRQIAERSLGGGTPKTSGTTEWWEFTPSQKLQLIADNLESLSKDIGLMFVTYDSTAKREEQVIEEAKAMGKELKDIYHRGNINSINRYSIVGSHLERCVIHLIKLNGVFYARCGNFLPYAKENADSNPKLSLALLESALSQIKFFPMSNTKLNRIITAGQQVRKAARQAGFDYGKLIKARGRMDEFQGDEEIKQFLNWCYVHLSDELYRFSKADIVSKREIELLQKELVG